MRRDPRGRVDGRSWEPNFLRCPRCDKELQQIPLTVQVTCDTCGKRLSYYCHKCQEITCVERHSLLKIKEIENEASLGKTSNLINWNICTPTKRVSCILSALIAIIVIAVSIFYRSQSPTNLSGSIEKLKASYPLQKSETWHHVLGVFDMQYPTVKTITLLHGEDKRTTDCFVRQLVSLFSKDEYIRIEDVTFNGGKGSEGDYGEVLEYYRPIVKKYKILVTDLSKVSGNLARIFHTLCDEVSSDIKPSLFIFTLKYNDRIETLKPLQRATAILTEAWSDLAENEIFPLLSRIVRNVVDVIPEGEADCKLQ